MKGAVGFNGLRIACIIGVHEQERLQAQEIIVDLRLEVDFSRVMESGKLEDAIDYASVAQQCEALAQEGNYLLLESYGQAVIEALSRDERILSVWIKIRKPAAIPAAQEAFIEIERNNHDLDTDYRGFKRARSHDLQGFHPKGRKNLTALSIE